MLNSVPSDDVSNLISPLNFAFIIEYDINSPRPVPSLPFVVIIYLNNLFLIESGIPGP